jgi:hypothetical protein
MVVRADAPIVVEGAEHFVERNYREGGRHQWVRETLVNAIEAGATRVEFGTEWQGVKVANVYRRTIADNGKGMTPDELLTFFKTYGGSGKPIGGLHENFGIGAKSSLFPWNTAGVVIVSWHPDYEEPSMIWVRKDPHSGKYGLRTWEAEEGGENVVTADDDEDLGIDWSRVKPDFIEDHGTVVVLLGDDLEQDTVLGDPNPNRDETGVPGVGIANYLNRRMWDMGDVVVRVDEYRAEDKSAWPRSRPVSVKGKLQQGRRRVRGARYYIQYPPGEDKGGRVAHQDEVQLADGTVIEWFLWEGKGREGIRAAASNGYVAASYAPSDNRTAPELFDVSEHPARLRGFGITETDVRRRVWLIAHPRLADSGVDGVYMSSDRNRLLIMGGPRAGDPLPWDDWAAEFAEKLPKPIIDAIAAARQGDADADLDASWRDRLAERFGRRWRQLRLIVDSKGDLTTEPDESGTKPRATGKKKKRTARRKRGSGGSGGRAGSNTVGSREGGTNPAREGSTAVGLPRVRWVDDEELYSPGMFAVWNPPSKAEPAGLIQMNPRHPVLEEEIRYWAPQYATHLEEEVTKIIKEVYAQLAAATVAHSESLKAHLSRKDVVEQLRTEEALTAALLGLLGADAIIGPRLGGALGRRKAVVGGS